MTPDAVPAPPGRRPKNKLGIAALILTLLAALAPLAVVIATWIAGATAYPDDVDNAVYVGLLGGFVFFLGTIALLSPVSFVGLVLGILSLWRAGSKAPGIVAIVIGVIGSLGLFGLPFVLGEIVPGR